AKEIDNARRELRRAHFQAEALVRVDRRAFFIKPAAANLVGQQPVNAIDPDQAEVLLVIFGPADLAFDQIAAPQFEAADLRLAYVDVFGTDHVAVAAQKAVAF